MLPRSMPRVWLTLPLVALAFVASSGCTQLGQAEPTPARRDAMPLRGLHVTAADLVWASGGNQVVRTSAFADQWQTTEVAAAIDIDLRDIHVFDHRTAVAMSSGTGPSSRIYRTTDGGEHWELSFENTDPEGFFDAMVWDRSGVGTVIGDPIGGRFMLLQSSDRGESFAALPDLARPVALPGEHLFAASGTCLAMHGEMLWFGTGGSLARVLRSPDRGQTWTEHPVPIVSGHSAAGVFSVAFADAINGVVVGGNYELPDASIHTAAWTNDGGVTWHPPVGRGPSGYRSAVAVVAGPGGEGSFAIAVGTNGADVSHDGGRTWSPVEAPKLNAVAITADRRRAIAVGPEGRIAIFAW